MRVGLLTNVNLDDYTLAGWTLPLMKRYCSIRGYSLYVGGGMSEEGMYERCAPQCETAMQFVPITFVITDPAIHIHNVPRGTMLNELGVDCGRDLSVIKALCEDLSLYCI